MGYIQSALIDGEEVRHMGRVSLWALARWSCLAGLAWIAAFAFAIMGLGLMTVLSAATGIVFICYVMVIYQTTELAVTNKRVISKRGLIARNTVEIGFSTVESVEVQQDIVGRMCGYGTILVSGTGTHTAEIPSVSNPMAFRQAFMTALDTYRR